MLARFGTGNAHITQFLMRLTAQNGGELGNRLGTDFVIDVADALQ